MIDEEKSHHSISRMYRVLGVTAAGYYASKGRAPSARAIEDEHLKRRIAFHHAASRGTYGVPRLYDDLADEGIRISRKRIARLMRELGIAGVSGREGTRRRRKSTVAETAAVADLVRRDVTADAPNQVRFADITYVPTWEGWLFLAVVMDACTKRIFGWSMRDDLKSDIVVDALGMATIKKDCVHRRHSSLGNLSPAESAFKFLNSTISSINQFDCFLFILRIFMNILRKWRACIFIRIFRKTIKR